MCTILRSPFPAVRAAHELVVHGTRIANINPPKLVVGVSLTTTSELQFPENTPIFPAVIDTGLNRTFEIHETHLNRWSGFVDALLDDIVENNYVLDSDRLSRSYKLTKACIWLHRRPYHEIQTRPFKKPFLLSKSQSVYLIRNDNGRIWPPLPLLGLEALTRNRLVLNVNSSRGRFSISR